MKNIRRKILTVILQQLFFDGTITTRRRCRALKIIAPLISLTMFAIVTSVILSSGHRAAVAAECWYGIGWWNDNDDLLAIVTSGSVAWNINGRINFYIIDELSGQKDKTKPVISVKVTDYSYETGDDENAELSGFANDINRTKELFFMLRFEEELPASLSDDEDLVALNRSICGESMR